MNRLRPTLWRTCRVLRPNRIQSNTKHRHQERCNHPTHFLRSYLIPHPLENVIDNFGKLPGQQRRNRIADLMVLLRAPALEKIVVRESLDSYCFTHDQISALRLS